MKGTHPKCRVCNHVERINIELELASGVSIRAIARKWQLPYHPTQRHWSGHVDDERKARLVLGPVQIHALQARVAEENSSVLDNLKIVRAGLFESYHTAMKVGDLFAVGALAGRIHENQRLVASITGELAQSPLVQNNSLTVVMESPQVQSFLQDLARQLQPHPDALRTVVAWLESREANDLAIVDRSPPAIEHHP